MVIDVQAGMFAEPENQPHEGAAVVARIAGLIAGARAAGTPLIFIQHDGGPGDTLEAGTPGFAFHPALTPAPGETLFVKRFCSAFQETGLGDYLAAQRITGLSICGMQTEYCVDTTCRAAFERGLEVTLISDAHTTFGSEALPASAIIAHHNATLGGGFARLCTAAEMVPAGNFA